jgi:GTP-binding protein
VLIETMRREGFELSISRPRVLFRDGPKAGGREEPYETVVIDVDDEFPARSSTRWRCARPR